ncbi:peptidoglycan DD-metalloendopeptidase family protein [Lederbergia citrisecunda]|uniref:peptidoglycan DD-metalloendopeptidase family protein n=1 Tax=Lederbergia citrisecunda TaxID=2833583 RepID=UPI003D2AF657
MTDFIMPNDGKITSHYGKRTHPITGVVGKMHWGTDFSGIYGTDPIYAVADGTVRLARMMNGFGNAVFITHKIKGITYESVYAHMSSFKVKAGDKVKQGQNIGSKGSTGSSTSKHLHFELTKGGLWENTYKYAVNPMHYLSDPETLKLQKLLNKHGYKLTEDGINGDSTTNALIKFQEKSGLVADGIAGEMTLKALNIKNAANSPTPQPSKPINKGDEDELKFSSGTLKKEFEIFIESRAQREIIVKYAVSQGYSQKWITDVMQGKAEDGDLVMLGLGAIIRANK